MSTYLVWPRSMSRGLPHGVGRWAATRTWRACVTAVLRPVPSVSPSARGPARAHETTTACTGWMPNDVHQGGPMHVHHPIENPTLLGNRQMQRGQCYSARGCYDTERSFLDWLASRQLLWDTAVSYPAILPAYMDHVPHWGS